MSPPTHSKTPATSTAEIDVITNRALLDYAEASRLAKSWLSGFPSTNTHNDEETDKEREAEEEAERKLLQNRDLYSETGGIGYKAPDSSSPSSSTRPAATDPTTTFLRKQLLGGRGGPRMGQNGQLHNATASRPRPQQARRQSRQDDDSDEEESRAAVGKKRMQGNGEATRHAAHLESIRDRNPIKISASSPLDSREPALENSVAVPEQPSRQATKPKANKNRGSSSYLDEILATRAAKRQKKSKAKEDTA